MRANSLHRKLFYLHLSFTIWKVLKGMGKLQKIEYLEKENNFLQEKKNGNFLRTIIW